MNIAEILVDVERHIHALEFDLTDAIAKRDTAAEHRVRFGIGLLVNLRSAWIVNQAAA